MIKVTREEPVEPLVTITTTEYGAEFIAYCLRWYAASHTTTKSESESAAVRAANALKCRTFEFKTDKVSKLFT